MRPKNLFAMIVFSSVILMASLLAGPVAANAATTEHRTSRATNPKSTLGNATLRRNDLYLKVPAPPSAYADTHRSIYLNASNYNWKVTLSWFNVYGDHISCQSSRRIYLKSGWYDWRITIAGASGRYDLVAFLTVKGTGNFASVEAHDCYPSNGSGKYDIVSTLDG